MPVKCPVSAIIKRRKVHGRECFEVLWEELYGIKSSVVPSDLVERYVAVIIIAYYHLIDVMLEQKKMKNLLCTPTKKWAFSYSI